MFASLPVINDMTFVDSWLIITSKILFGKHTVMWDIICSFMCKHKHRIKLRLITVPVNFSYKNVTSKCVHGLDIHSVKV